MVTWKVDVPGAIWNPDCIEMTSEFWKLKFCFSDVSGFIMPTVSKQKTAKPPSLMANTAASSLQQIKKKGLNEYRKFN